MKPARDHLVLLLLALATVVAQAAPPSYSLGQKASVLVFTTIDCPIANAMLPELSRLQKAFEPKGVAFTLVHVDPDTTAATARKHELSYEVNIPFVLDPDHALVKRFGATRTPEAFVITPDGRTAYHGRINDLYHAPGKRRREPSSNDLRDVLTAIISGQLVPTKHQPATGCVIADFAK